MTAPDPLTPAQQEAADGSPAHVELFAHENETHRGPFGYIKFQLGPLPVVGPNGVYIEDVIAVLVERLDGFQQGAFACHENDMAIRMLGHAQDQLRQRKNRRTAAGLGPYDAEEANGQTSAPPVAEADAEPPAADGPAEAGADEAVAPGAVDPGGSAQPAQAPGVPTGITGSEAGAGTDDGDAGGADAAGVRAEP